jgi:hypothetical protein
MSTTTWMKAPADLLGLGGSAASPCAGLDHRTVIGVTPAARVAPFQGTGVPAGIAVRLRPVVLQNPVTSYAHNFIGTTLGIHPSGRPLS